MCPPADAPSSRLATAARIRAQPSPSRAISMPSSSICAFAVVSVVPNAATTFSRPSWDSEYLEPLGSIILCSFCSSNMKHSMKQHKCHASVMMWLAAVTVDDPCLCKRTEFQLQVMSTHLYERLLTLCHSIWAGCIATKSCSKCSRTGKHMH